MPGVRVLTALGAWGTVGLIWFAMRPMQIAGKLAWSAYKQSQQLTEESRDYHLRLQQTLEDLSTANQQLVHLNRLADGLRQAAEEARRAKEQFVANVSHELRTPLNMIIGFSEMIVNAPQAYGRRLPTALLADLAVILRNSQHLADLINDVLDLSQLEAGQMALVREQIALPEVVGAAAMAVRPLFESKGLYLRTELPDDLPPVSADRTRIREVMLNLLSNAGRFTERGGITVRGQRRSNDLVISVADTGPGIAAADQERLFQPFQQLDGSLSRRYGGAGLGLSISREFVELHGGKMWVESEPGAGATFFFTLPLDNSPAPSASAQRWLMPGWEFLQRTRPSLVQPAPTRPRIVVCEAGESLQRWLTRYLSHVEIVAVPDMTKAVEKLTTGPAQALLVNVASVAETLQQSDLVAWLPNNVPLIICSAPGVSAAAHSLGVADYLIKPIARETLLATLDRLRLKGKTILVADDDADTLRLFRRVLSSAEQGYRVLTATDGREAWRVLCEERPDAILLDLFMPEMDGFELLAAKNADPLLRDIPTAVISARDPLGRPIVSRALAVTCSAGLSLPQLLACIEALSAILSPLHSPVDPARPAASPE
jgi:signal transduction histidine kinase/CheY-like chemotaxis protein